MSDFKSSMDSALTPFEIARREYQRKENERIGQGADDMPPIPELLTLDDALDRFAFLSDGSRVVDMFDPRFSMSFQDWANTYAASTYKKSRKILKVSNEWRDSDQRKTVIGQTFKAGDGITVKDPEGRLCVNTWKPYDRFAPSDGDDQNLHLFTNHVDYLFGSDADRFTKWLAHIEQKPGELPHTAWLHIATNFGMGRNWLSGVLARVWAGKVACNIDLPKLFDGSFNSVLSGKVLGVVDEIHEGGSNRWKHNEKMKSFITEETREINPKFGRKYVEHNSCRVLMFSNHISAIPIERNDRRIEVVINKDKPMGEKYYRDLYGSINDPIFINSVAHYLSSIDISDFNPGANATLNEAKMDVQDSSKSEADEFAELLLKYWPSDLISAKNLSNALTGFDSNANSAVVRHVKERYGFKSLAQSVRIKSSVFKAVAVRDADKFCSKDRISNQILTDELQKSPPNMSLENAGEAIQTWLLGQLAEKDDL